MWFLLQIAILALVTSLGGCSLLNKKEVVVLVDSDPVGADIYVDNQLYGKTPGIIEVMPDKDRQLVVKKNGYIPQSAIMESEYSLRKNARKDDSDSKRCTLDAIGSFWVVPYFVLRSIYCRNFTQNIYSFDLDDAPQPVHQNTHNMMDSIYNQPAVTPFLQHNYYSLPSKNVDQNSDGNNSADVMSDNSGMIKPSSSTQPIFNNQSEYINQGNSVDNYNKKRALDYYNWQ